MRDDKGRFDFGNTIGPGRKKIFDCPEKFKKLCEGYFDWADKNPILKRDVVKSGDNAGNVIETPVQRPYTLIALCHFLKISQFCFKDYHKDPRFYEVCTRVREKIENQQVEGALAGIYNANLTARLNGYANRIQHEGGESPIKSEINVVFSNNGED